MLAWQAVLAPCRELPEAAFWPCSTQYSLYEKLACYHAVMLRGHAACC